jgi:hypothetical protein
MTQPEEIATLLHWIKGRDAAFFLSLQSCDALKLRCSD